ncbi:MAG TPA: hypothetical protein DHV62_00545 [Elusimicrobia bacterium]|jgi:uncharacterized membrane protein|nr:hypothetical protein [Elusimicrobiota bacterium]
MKPFKLQIIFGLILLIIGFTFDFTFVQTQMSRAFKNDPVSYLNSFSKQLYDLTKFYMLGLGLINITLALLGLHLRNQPKLDWTICGLMLIGSILVIVTGFWYAKAGPSFKWELRCTVLTIGLFSILLGLVLEIYKSVSGTSAKK